MDSLDKAREIINDTDRQIAELFEKRMQAVRTVAQYKREKGLPVLDAGREKSLLEKNSALISDDELRGYYVNLQKKVMEISKSYQHRILQGMNVAYSGVEGAYAYIAAARVFPDGSKRSYKDFKQAYSAVESGECDCAVLPIENSRAGEVGQVIDLIFQGSLFINGVYSLQIKHNLVALPGARLENIKTVISHQQALDQCRSFLSSLGVKTVSSENTAASAKLVAQSGDLTVAAVASSDTAELYGLEVIKQGINESYDNTTRFAVLSRSLHECSHDHSIIVFTVPDEAGSLAKTINTIANHGYNMRCIKSRAMKGLMWRYYFYVELEGNLYHRRGRFMLEELSERCENLRFIGTFNALAQI